MESVWIDWGGGPDELPQRFDFPTLAQLNAFLKGVEAAATAWGIDDFAQFNSQAEVDEYVSLCNA